MIKDGSSMKTCKKEEKKKQERRRRRRRRRLDKTQSRKIH
jgi:hypothetical protein